MTKPVVVAVLITASFAFRQDPQQQVPPPQPAPVRVTTPGAPPPPAPVTAPVLPDAARQLVDQATTDLIQRLEALQESYMAQKRPDDAAAVRTQIRLLLRATGMADDSPKPDKVDLSQYRDRVGQMFQFIVTGSADKPVWGSAIYTDDTPIESAAVHAGVLRSGQTGAVRVTILSGQQQYVGSTRNGIESVSTGPSAGSYRVETGPGTNARPTSIANFRGRFGETVTVPVMGTVKGTVWGVDLYTDDSTLGAAAVHAGILNDGEFGFVSVTILGGQARYPGATRFGVVSQEYAEWEGSFKLAKAPQPWKLRLPDDVVDATGMVSLPTLRDKSGLSFSLIVVGAAGPLRGSDVYTDDSSIAAAAVHSGALKLGEKGYVRVTVLPGLGAYVSSDRNGVKSADAGAWQGSFRVDAVPKGG